MALLHQYQMAQGQNIQNPMGQIPQYGMPFNQNNGLQQSQSGTQIPQQYQFQQQGQANYGYPVQQTNQLNQIQQGNQPQMMQKQPQLVQPQQQPQQQQQMPVIHPQKQHPQQFVQPQGSFQQPQPNIQQQPQQFIQNQPITSTVAPMVSQGVNSPQVTSVISPIVPQNTVPTSVQQGAPVVAPIVPQTVASNQQQHVQPQAQTCQDANQGCQVPVSSEPTIMNVAPVEPVTPLNQQQQVVSQSPQEPTQATVAPQRFTPQVQSVEHESVVEQQIVSLDETNSEAENSVVVDQQNLESVPIVNPIPIVPQQNQDNQHFIAPVQPQVEQ